MFWVCLSALPRDLNVERFYEYYYSERLVLHIMAIRAFIWCQIDLTHSEYQKSGLVLPPKKSLHSGAPDHHCSGHPTTSLASTQEWHTFCSTQFSWVEYTLSVQLSWTECLSVYSAHYAEYYSGIQFSWVEQRGYIQLSWTELNWMPEYECTHTFDPRLLRCSRKK